MPRLRRAAAALMAAVLVGTMSWADLSSGQADELSDAEAKLTELQGAASQAAEQFNQIQAQLDAAQAKLAQDQQAVADQRAQVESLRQQVALISLQQFQDRGLTSTAVLFTSADKEEVINSFMMSSMVSDATAALLQNYQLGQAALADLERSQQATVAQIEADKSRQEQLKTEADQKVAEMETLVKRLEAEKARLAQAQASQPAYGGASGDYGDYTPPPPVQNGAAAQLLVDWAMARVGLPYVYGGSGPGAYDCSGFTQAAYAYIGISLPHSASAQFNYGVPVARADLQPGDLVFFYNDIGHVGLYVGAGMFVDARNPSDGVVYAPLNNIMPFAGARRLL